MNIISERYDKLPDLVKEMKVELYYKMLSGYKTKTEIMIDLGLTEYEFKRFRKFYIDPEEESLYELHRDLIQLAKKNGVTQKKLKERLAEGLGVYVSATYPPDFTVDMIKGCEYQTNEG